MDEFVHLVASLPFHAKFVCYSDLIDNYYMMFIGLVLVADPYYLEPGYEKERSTEIGRQKSREYNESAILLTLHVSMTIPIRQLLYVID